MSPCPDATARDRHWAEVAIAESKGERSVRRARALGFAGIFAAHSQEWNLARDYDQEALLILRELGERSDSVWLLPHLSHVAVELGDYDAAERLLEEAAAVAAEIGDRWILASCDGHLADLALRAGDDSRALELAESALEYYRERGWSAGIAWCLHLRGVALLRIGVLSEADASANEGLAIAHSIGDAETRIWFLALFAALRSRMGRPEVGAVLLGTIAAGSDRLGLTLTGVEAELRDDAEVEVRTQLEASRYEAEYAKGIAMSEDDVMNLALASVSETC